MTQVTINYGATAPALVDQLEPQGQTLPNPDKWEELRVALLRLSFSGVLTEAMTEKAFGRLNNSILKNITEIKPGGN